MDMVMLLVNVAAAEPLVPIGIKAHAGKIVPGDFRPFRIHWLFAWGTRKTDMKDWIFDSRPKAPRGRKLARQFAGLSAQDISGSHHRHSSARVIILARPKQVFQPAAESVPFCYFALHFAQSPLDDICFWVPSNLATLPTQRICRGNM